MAAMPKPRKPALSIHDFVEWTEQIVWSCTDQDLALESPWFRGVASSDFKLTPSLYRSEVGKEITSDADLRAEFKRRGLPLVAERPPRDDWEWYFLMQHYGAPTRLLDWTDSALVALYFAITSSGGDGAAATPAVWALNPWKWNEKVGMQFAGPLVSTLPEMSHYLGPPYEESQLPKYPVALDPTFIAQRMLVQHSHFTLHGCDFRGLDEMSELGLENMLFKLEISSRGDSLKILRQRVAQLGISETTIFPDLQGLGKELRLEYDIS